MEENPYTSPIGGTIDDQPTLLTRLLHRRFTLVELSVVIAIIAILWSLLRPARSQGRRPQSKPRSVSEQR